MTTNDGKRSCVDCERQVIPNRMRCWQHLQRRGTFKHGTLHAYKHHGCRCDLCRRVSAAFSASWYQARKARGICVRCVAPAAPRRTRCLKHLQMDRREAA